MLLTLSFLSCGVNTSMVHSHNLNQTQVTLDKANFIVIDLITGKDSATYILGFGGLRNRSTLQNAYSDMIKSADLQGKPRAIINVTHETHLTSILSPIFLKKTVFVHGLLIEFTGDPNVNNTSTKSARDEASQNANGFGEQPDLTPSAQQNASEGAAGNQRKTYSANDCKVGDTVTFMYKHKQLKGQIVKIWSDGTIIVKHPTSKGKKRIYAASIIDLKSVE